MFACDMRRWIILLVCAMLLGPLSGARAAVLTDVLDAADKVWVGGDRYKDDAFDMTLGVRYSGGIEQGLISRENPTTTPDLAKELRYRSTLSMLDFELDLGLYHDLGIYVNLPLVLEKSNSYHFSSGTTVNNSSIWNGNASDPANILWFDPTKPFTIAHEGLGDMQVGLRWSPLNDERDSSLATWTLGFTYQIPTATALKPENVDPANITIDSDRKISGFPFGDGAHRLIFTLGMSKRLFLPRAAAIDRNARRRGYMDPYFHMWYALPFASSKSVAADPADIAQHPKITSALIPSHAGGFVMGFEAVPLEDVELQRKIAIDLGGFATYVSEGRSHTQVSDAIDRVITYHENYINVGVHLNLVIQAAEFIQFRLGLSLGHQTGHFLTTESAGEDLNGDEQIIQGDDWVSPYWDPRLDQIGGRFRIEETVIFSYHAQLLLTF